MKDKVIVIFKTQSRASFWLKKKPKPILSTCAHCLLFKINKDGGRAGAMIREINKSPTGHEHMGPQAGWGYLERVSQCWEDEGCMWGREGGWGQSKDQRCELRADRAASLNLVYHIRHGNITSIFFSLQDQSLLNPFKQQWNNSLFVLCGLWSVFVADMDARRTNFFFFFPSERPTTTIHMHVECCQ